MAVDGVAVARTIGLRRTSLRSIDFARSGAYFAGFLLLTLLAFWPTYLSLPLRQSSGYTHFHAATATLWMAFLVAQPMAIRARRLALHRAIGRASYVAAPLALVAMVLLAHNRIRTATAEAYAIQTYVLYLQVSLAVVFALCYGLGVARRRNAAVHASFMVCTGLTLVDPVLVRIMFWIDPTPSWNYQWLTFGVTDLLLVLLIWLERRRPEPRKVFKAMLLVFALSQLPALLALTATAPWQRFAAWFAALPLT